MIKELRRFILTPVMSFWPKIYDKIISQTKLIEYRRIFPKDCTMAYMYISKPVKAICAIIHFGKIHSLYDWQQEFIEYPEVQLRIKESLENENYRYGAEISTIQKIKPISLVELHKNIPNFVAPQSYLLLENNHELKKYIEEHTLYIEPPIKNNLVSIFPEHICKRY